MSHATEIPSPSESASPSPRKDFVASAWKSLVLNRARELRDAVHFVESERGHAPPILAHRPVGVMRGAPLDGLLQGDYRTLFRGFGLDLADLREYQLHDDVRYIDWNVTARLQTPYVREYHEDR